MINVLNGDFPTGLDEYELLLAEPQFTICEFYISLSDIERAYSYTLIRVSGYLPWFYTLKLPGTLYKYIPDQRPITMRLIGKPSPGPAPPALSNASVMLIRQRILELKN
jgi:hypothetical protein